MERIKTIATRDLTKSVKTGGCGECQPSRLPASPLARPPAAWLTSSARTATSNFCKPYAAFAGRHFFVYQTGME